MNPIHLYITVCFQIFLLRNIMQKKSSQLKKLIPLVDKKNFKLNKNQHSRVSLGGFT